jgi:hypothetical protein
MQAGDVEDLIEHRIARSGRQNPRRPDDYRTPCRLSLLSNEKRNDGKLQRETLGFPLFMTWQRCEQIAGQFAAKQ